MQGWIKGLNASFLDPNRDIGKDGISASTVRKDAVGYTINYFDGDYKPIGATAKTDAGRFDVKMTNSSGDYRSKGLFNGNIRSIASQTEGLGKPILMSYDYDQLNRLNKMESNALTINTNTWNRATPAESRWREDVTYDANGNIKAYKRNDQFGTVLMDNLQYSYTPNTNQLASVADYAPTSNYKDDVEGITGNTFQYDKIGNLTYETKNGSRSTSFNWNVYGKMLTAYDWDYDAQNVVVASYAQYSYDAQQNRFKKQQTTSRLVNNVWQNQTSTDYYIRDAQGNVLAIYQQKDNNFVWKEQHLYGSSRLGMWQPEKVLSGVVLPMLGVCGDGQGVRLYELTNHLGNVLATINDKGKVVSAQDYFPFGLKLDGRMFNTEGYRFGFNGKEYDGVFKSYDYGARVYKDNLGRFLSVDPLTEEYPWYTPYQFAGNKPIWAVDLDGLEELFATEMSVSGGISTEFRRNRFAQPSDIGTMQYTYMDGTRSASNMPIGVSISAGSLADLRAGSRQTRTGSEAVFSIRSPPYSVTKKPAPPPPPPAVIEDKPTPGKVVTENIKPKVTKPLGPKKGKDADTPPPNNKTLPDVYTASVVFEGSSNQVKSGWDEVWKVYENLKNNPNMKVTISANIGYEKYEDDKTTPLGTGSKVWNAVTNGKMTDVMTGKVTFSYQKGELMDIRADKIKADLIGRGISEDRINVTRGGATGSPKGRTVTFTFQ